MWSWSKRCNRLDVVEVLSSDRTPCSTQLVFLCSKGISMTCWETPSSSYAQKSRDADYFATSVMALTCKFYSRLEVMKREKVNSFAPHYIYGMSWRCIIWVRLWSIQWFTVARQWVAVFFPSQTSLTDTSWPTSKGWLVGLGGKAEQRTCNRVHATFFLE